jgi:hypothetical protein
MLNKQSISTLLRTFLIAGSACAIAACGGHGASDPGSALPPTSAGLDTPPPTTATLSTTTSTAPSVVQSANGNAFAPASITVSYPSAPAAGHVLIVAFWNNGNTSGGGITYKAPSGWSMVDANTKASYHTYEVFSHVVASGETGKYVFVPTYAQREHVWMAADIANTAGVDRHGSSYISGSAFKTPTVTPSQSNDLALAFDAPQTTGTWTNGSGWTRSNGPTSVWSGQTVYERLSSTAAIAQSATLSAASSGFAGIVLLKPGSGTTTATPVPQASPTSAPSAAPIASSTSAPVSAGVATYHGCPLYTANDWFTTNLVTGGSSYVPNTIDPNSANIINNIAANVGNINFNGNVNPAEETVNVDNETNVVADPQVQGLVYGWANDPYNDDPAPAHIPITSGTFFQEGTYSKCNISGGDCHVNVLDTVKCVEYETYKSGTYGNGVTGSWNGSTYWAEGGGVENLNHPYHIEPLAVTAADIPMMGTTDWGEDLQYQKASCQPNCAIPHILAFFLPQAGQANGGYVAPAGGEQHACSSYCTHPLPEGARLRLKSSYPCPSPTSYPQANLLCNQMKQYGIILNDFTGRLPNGGGVRLATSSNGTNPWNSSDYGQLLNNVHITNFDVMTLGTIHP